MGSLASAAVAQVALVITGVVAARTLGPADRGYLALVILVPAVLHGVGALGLPRAVTYFIANDPAHETSVVRAIRTPAIAQAVVLTALQAGILSVLLAEEPTRVKWAGLAVMPLLAANLADMYGKAILQGERRYAAFNILRNAGLGFYLVGVLLLLAVGQTGLVEFAIAYVLATVLSAIVTLSVVMIRSSPESKPVDVSRRTLVRFGLRGYLVGLSPGTLRLDQAVIGLLLAPQALGVYVVGLAFTNLPTFISRSIGFIAFPQVADAMTPREDEARRFLWFSLALSGGAVVTLELGAGWFSCPLLRAGVRRCRSSHANSPPRGVLRGRSARSCQHLERERSTWHRKPRRAEIVARPRPGSRSPDAPMGGEGRCRSHYDRFRGQLPDPRRPRPQFRRAELRTNGTRPASVNVALL